MFLISVGFRPTRSKGNKEKPGVVFYRVTRYGSGEKKIERTVNSDIHGSDEGIIQVEREKILSQIRLLYCIIERREDSKEPYTIDDALNDFRKALVGDESMEEVIARSKTEFPIRRDIVSICLEFRGAFTFVFSGRKDNGESLFDYIFNLKQNLKTERRHSRANSFASLQSSLSDFVASDDGDEEECGETMHVILDEVDTRKYSSIVFAAVVAKDRIAAGETFADAHDPIVSIYNAETDEEVAEYKLASDFPGKDAVCFGRMDFDSKTMLWNFVPMDDSYNGGMQYLATEVYN